VTEAQKSDAERKMQFLFTLRSKGVTDKRVLSAMEDIDRGHFVRGIFSERAYEDMPLPIPCGPILSKLARRVYTIDRHPRLVREASALFAKLDLHNITATTSDGARGLPDQAPFDRIIVTAAAEDPPSPLLAQLTIGGMMVVPVGQSDTVQSLIKVTRTEEGFDYEELLPVRFVPLLEGIGRE